MTPESVDLSVTIHLGNRYRRLPLLALAAALHLPREPLRLTLAGLVLALEGETNAGSFSREPTEGAERSSSIETFSEKEKTIGSVDRSSMGDAVVETGERPTARFLAELLDDLPNLPALERLVAATPTAVITAALDETLALPDHRIRRTRAAYFTAAVRRRLSSDRASFTS